MVSCTCGSSLAEHMSLSIDGRLCHQFWFIHPDFCCPKLYTTEINLENGQRINIKYVNGLCLFQYILWFTSRYKYSFAEFVTSAAAVVLFQLFRCWHTSVSETNAVWHTASPWRTQQPHGWSWQHPCTRCSSRSHKSNFFVVNTIYRIVSVNIGQEQEGILP